MLVEKAFAKIYGSYYRIEGGIVSNALTDLTGGFSSYMLISEFESNPMLL